MQQRSLVPKNFPAFYYGSIASFWAHFKVDPDRMDRKLAGTGLHAARFRDRSGTYGLANINLMNYASHLGANNPFTQKDPDPFKRQLGVEATNEVEFNVAVVPDAWTKRAPDDLSGDSYLTNGDVTKTIGNYRIWVPCDDPIAIKAGQENFGEAKYLAKFIYAVPTLNNPKQKAWEFSILDPRAARPSQFIVRVTANPTGLDAVTGNMSELLDVSLYPFNPDPRRPAKQRPVVSRRNNLGIYRTWLLGREARRVKVEFGPGQSPMKPLVRYVFGDAVPFAMQAIESPTPVAESHPFWGDIA